MSLSLSTFKVQVFKHFPTHLLKKHGPKQWSRMRILQACERLGIPTKLWPKFPFPEPPRPQQFRYSVSKPLLLPEYWFSYESEAEWIARVQACVDQFVAKELERFRDRLKSELATGRLTRIKQIRDTTPLDLRYEWTAKRLCYGLPYSELAKHGSGGYNADRIKHNVNAILREAALRPRRSAGSR